MSTTIVKQYPLKMSIKSVHKIVPKKCPQKASTKCVLNKCPQKVSTKNVHKTLPQKFSTKKVSKWSVHKKFQHRMSKSVHKKCPQNSPQKKYTKFVHKIWPQKLATKRVHKKCPQKCVGWGGRREWGGEGPPNERDGNCSCDLRANESPHKKLHPMYIESSKKSIFTRWRWERNLQIFIKLIMPPAGLPNRGLKKKLYAK